MHKAYIQDLQTELDLNRENGLYNNIRVVQSQQGPYLTLNDTNYLNLSSNNYLGFASDERLKAAAKKALETHGVGLSLIHIWIRN